MGLIDICYYFVAFAMMAGIIIAYLLDLNTDQKPSGKIYVRFGTSDDL